MKTWLAVDELRTAGTVDALLGLAMLVAALALGAEPLWLAVAGLVLLALAREPIRRAEGELAGSVPAPAEVAVGSRRAIVVRHLPASLTFALVGVACATLAPLMLGFFGLAALFGATIRLGRARAITRWERRHGGRVLRTGGFAKADRFFVAH